MASRLGALSSNFGEPIRLFKEPADAAQKIVAQEAAGYTVNFRNERTPENVEKLREPSASVCFAPLEVITQVSQELAAAEVAEKCTKAKEHLGALQNEVDTADRAYETAFAALSNCHKLCQLSLTDENRRRLDNLVKIVQVLSDTCFIKNRELLKAQQTFQT